MHKVDAVSSMSIYLVEQPLSDVPPNIYCKKRFSPSVENPTEIIYELIPNGQRMGFGVNLADIWEHRGYYHERTDKSLCVIGGALEVTLKSPEFPFGKVHTLRPGDSLFIPRGMTHSAKSLEGEPSRVVVVSMPPWDLEDYHPADEVPSDITAIRASSATPPLDTNLPLISVDHYLQREDSYNATNYRLVLPDHGLKCAVSIVDLDRDDPTPHTPNENRHYTVIAGAVEFIDEEGFHELTVGSTAQIQAKRPFSIFLNDAPARLVEVRMLGP